MKVTRQLILEQKRNLEFRTYVQQTTINDISPSLNAVTVKYSTKLNTFSLSHLKNGHIPHEKSTTVCISRKKYCLKFAGKVMLPWQYRHTALLLADALLQWVTGLHTWLMIRVQACIRMFAVAWVNIISEKWFLFYNISHKTCAITACRKSSVKQRAIRLCLRFKSVEKLERHLTPQAW